MTSGQEQEKSSSAELAQENSHKMPQKDAEVAQTKGDVNGSQAEDVNGAGTKRKVSGTTDGAPSKTAKKEMDNDVKEAEKSSTDSAQIVKFLLSNEGLALCRPDDESKAIEEQKGGMRTYSASAFNPFEELMCALILSRPIGHMLGVRSIRTLFNAPHNLCTPAALTKAGFEGCRQALDEARTQHRQKTAEELVMLAEAVADHFGRDGDDVELTKIRQDAGHDAAKEREILQKNIKGMGKTGLDIFARRIQGAWAEFYPFCDDRTLTATTKLGLGQSAEEIAKTIETHWTDIEPQVEDLQTVSDKMDDAERKRRAFVQVLERAVGAELEGKLDDVLAATT